VAEIITQVASLRHIRDCKQALLQLQKHLRREGCVCGGALMVWDLILLGESSQRRSPLYTGCRRAPWRTRAQSWSTTKCYLVPRPVFTLSSLFF